MRITGPSPGKHKVCDPQEQCEKNSRRPKKPDGSRPLARLEAYRRRCLMPAGGARSFSLRRSLLCNRGQDVLGRGQIGLGSRPRGLWPAPGPLARVSRTGWILRWPRMLTLLWQARIRERGGANARVGTPALTRGFRLPITRSQLGLPEGFGRRRYRRMKWTELQEPGRRSPGGVRHEP